MEPRLKRTVTSLEVSYSQANIAVLVNRVRKKNKLFFQNWFTLDLKYLHVTLATFLSNFFSKTERNSAGNI